MRKQGIGLLELVSTPPLRGASSEGQGEGSSRTPRSWPLAPSSEAVLTWAIVLLCLGVEAAWAKEACVTIDTRGWSQEQKNLRAAGAYRLAYEAGHDLAPTIRGHAICFANPRFAVGQLITPERLLAKITELQAASAAEQAQAQALQTELERLERDLAAATTNWEAMPTEEQLAITKKLLRRDALKRELENLGQ